MKTTGLSAIQAIEAFLAGRCEGFRSEQDTCFWDDTSDVIGFWRFQPGNTFSLINPKPRTEEARVKGWVNVYQKSVNPHLYGTKEDADTAAASNRIACIEINTTYQREVPEEEPVEIKAQVSIDWAVYALPAKWAGKKVIIRLEGEQ